MAAGGRRPGGDTPWWVTGIKVVAGIGAAALGAYAAAKAAESAFQEEKPMTSRMAEEKSHTDKGKPCYSDSSDSDDDDDDHWVEVNDDDEYSDSSDNDNGYGRPTAEDKPSTVDPSKPLVDQLEQYFLNKVEVQEEEVTAMKAVAEQVAQSITEYICGRHPKLLQGKCFATGSAYEGTATQHPDRFVVIVPLSLEANLWKVVDAKNTVLKVPGYSLIHRVNTDLYRPGSSIWDKFLVGTYVNPELIQRFLEGVLQKVTNKGFTFCYGDYYVTKSDKALTLEIIRPVGGLIDHLTIQAIPSVTMECSGGSVCLDGVPYGCLSESKQSSKRERDRSDSNPYENLWQQSTRIQEKEMIQVLDEDGGCRKKCLQTLKVVCLNQSPLSSLPAYHLKTVFLHLCDEESEWEDVMMAERFLDLFKRLEQFLEDQYLPNFFLPDVNMFEGFSPRHLSKIKNWLKKRLTQPSRIHMLLV